MLYKNDYHQLFILKYPPSIISTAQVDGSSYLFASFFCQFSGNSIHICLAVWIKAQLVLLINSAPSNNRFTDWLYVTFRWSFKDQGTSVFWNVTSLTLAFVFVSFQSSCLLSGKVGVGRSGILNLHLRLHTLQMTRG